jgi:hypothetical protein
MLQGIIQTKTDPTPLHSLLNGMHSPLLISLSFGAGIMAIYKLTAPAPSAGIVRLFPKLRQLVVLKFFFSLKHVIPFSRH